MKKYLVVCCLVFEMFSYADAALIQWDAFSSGDQLAVKDQETGLVWLDLSLTAGKYFNTASNLYSGWELANYSDVESLLSNVFPNIIHSGAYGQINKFEEGCSNTSLCFNSVEAWESLFGYVSGVDKSYQRYSYGLYKDAESVLRMGGSFKNGSGSANRYGVDYNVGYSANYDSKHANGEFAYYGVFLVKEATPDQNSVSIFLVSEPSKLLLCWGLVLMYLLRRNIIT